MRRRTASRVVQTVLSIGMVALAVAALYISVLVFQRQEALTQIFRYNIAYSASQGMNELLRFRQRLAATPEVYDMLSLVDHQSLRELC